MTPRITDRRSLTLVAGLTPAIAALPAAGPWLHWAGSNH
jgi:hypothetical protein